MEIVEVATPDSFWQFTDESEFNVHPPVPAKFDKVTDVSSKLLLSISASGNALKPIVSP